MRKAYNDYGIITHDDQFLGISLGYDFTSEHEWGIKGIRNKFGIPESSKKNMGVDSRTITTIPKVVYVNENKKKDDPIELLFFKKSKKKGQSYAIMWVGSSYADPIDRLPHEMKNYKEDLDFGEEWNKDKSEEDKKDPVVTAWDENSFAVGVKGEEEVKLLETLYGEFKKNNIVISRIDLSMGNPFSNSSLSLLIKDRIPQEGLDTWYDADKEYYDREDYEKKIGMKKIIQKHGNKNGYNGENHFLACSPKWLDYEDKENRKKKKKEWGTKYDIIYWVNYSDADDTHAYFTVEEIKKWLTTDGLTLLEVRAETESVTK